MKRTILLMASVLLLLLPTWGVWSFTGQPPEIEEILRQEDALLCDSRYEEALALLEGVSASYPGTRQDAAARMEAAALHGKAFHDLERCRQVYGSIVQDFPQTMEAVLAASNLADLDLGENRPPFTEYLARIDGLVRDCGGIPLDEVAHSTTRRQFAPLSWLGPQDQADLLADLYFLTASRIAARPRQEWTRELLTCGLNIHTFVRERFPGAYGRSVSDSQREMILRLGGNARPEVVRDETPPRLHVVAPRRGVTMADRQPKVEIHLDDGDLAEAELDLGETQIRVDGVDVLGQAEIRSLVNPSGRPGPTFEKVQISWRPTSPLSPGLHRVEVEAADHAGNLAREAWSFTLR